MARSARPRTSASEASWQLLNRRIIACERCPRLRDHCRRVAQTKRRAYGDWQYWGKPVPNFGDPRARLLIVGLAPAAHGANRTGRMFTGDRSGHWLYEALYRAGFANQADSVSVDDALELRDCAITAVCHCAPPRNRPTPREMAECRPWLEHSIDLVPARVLLALGQVAWNALVSEAIRRSWYTGRRPRFGHGVEIPLNHGRWLLASYHPSQQNTFTGRLTRIMFDRVFRRARALLAADKP
jgi:uracil-DNA glycosylase family 4